jgi:hypothetical protein
LAADTAGVAGFAVAAGASAAGFSVDGAGVAAGGAGVSLGGGGVGVGAGAGVAAGGSEGGADGCGPPQPATARVSTHAKPAIHLFIIELLVRVVSLPPTTYHLAIE